MVRTLNFVFQLQGNAIKPAEISYESLIHIMDPGKFDEEIDFEMRYLD